MLTQGLLPTSGARDFQALAAGTSRDPLASYVLLNDKRRIVLKSFTIRRAHGPVAIEEHSRFTSREALKCLLWRAARGRRTNHLRLNFLLRFVSLLEEDSHTQDRSQCSGMGSFTWVAHGALPQEYQLRLDVCAKSMLPLSGRIRCNSPSVIHPHLILPSSTVSP